MNFGKVTKQIRLLAAFKLSMPQIMTLIVSVALLSAQSVAQEQRYVSDIFYVPLHSGNSTKHRIIHRGLKTGTPLTLLETDNDAGFSRVRTSKGTEGWIQNQFLANTPIARSQLVGLKQQYDTLKEKMAAVKENSQQTQQSNSEIQKQVTLLSRENQNLTSELASMSC